MARPLQVYVDEAELQRLEAWSKKRGWTKSQAIRVALRALTGGDEPDPLLAASGMIQGLPPELSESFDQALQETFVVAPKKHAPPPARAGRSKARVRRQ